LKLRLVVARFGEMDLARWWNTKGQLGRVGAMAVRRGFPRTHRFAQARAVFAVAARRCLEVYDPPRSVTLWRLSSSIEEGFDARWEHWLSEPEAWEPFFKKVEALPPGDLAAVLRDLELAGPADLEAAARLRRSAEGRAVALPFQFADLDAQVTQLALGFARGEPGELAVPFAASPEDA
jgi:hypothetical protein